MKAPARLENAVLKLYSAFHGGTLNPECCKSCAVGNILNNADSWKHLLEAHGTLRLSYVGKVHEMMGRKFNGYSPSELMQIERIFLKGCGYGIPLLANSKKPKNPNDKETLFNGLCATIEFLCELDDVENVMDYSKLFEIENQQPKYKLAFPAT